MSKEIQEEELSFKDIILTTKKLIQYLWTKWLVIVIIGLLGGTIGFIHASMQKPVYTAQLSFVLEDEKGGGGGLSGALGLASSLGLDLGTNGGGAFTGINLMELMKSRSMVERALLSPITINGNVQSLADFYLDFSKKREAFQKKPLLASIHFPPDGNRKNYTLQQDSVLGSIYSGLTNKNLSIAQKDKKSSIIDVSLKSENEIFAKKFVETLTSEVAQFYIDTKTKKTVANVAILQKQTDSVRSALNSAITGVAAANDNIFNLNPSLNIKRTPSQQRQVDVQANTAILTELVKNLELAKVTLRKETPLIQIIDSPIYPLKKEKKSRLISLIVGGLLGGIFSIGYLLLRRWWKNEMQEK